jgi:hypothetical protein
MDARINQSPSCLLLHEPDQRERSSSQPSTFDYWESRLATDTPILADTRLIRARPLISATRDA